MTAKVYNVPVTLVVRAESREDALRVAEGELDYLCRPADSPALAYDMPTNDEAHHVTEEEDE
jgi:hypothetical protein